MMRVAAVGLRGLPHVIGGIETQCEQIYAEMLLQIPDCAIHVFARSAYVPRHLREHLGIHIHRLWAPHIKGLEAFVHSFLAILHARIILGIRILHVHGIGPAFWTPMARLLGMHVVVTHHAPDFKRPKWGKLARIVLKIGEYFAAHFAQAVVCVSHAVEKSFLERYPKAASRTTVITNAVGVPEKDSAVANRVFQTFGLQPNNFVLAAGRLDETKRFEDLLIASEKLNGSAQRLVIAGSSADTDPHEAWLRDHAGSNIILTGFCSGPELAALYRNCSLFIHPSEMEGFGLVVLEALTSGARVALSDIPPHREFGLPEHCYFEVGDIDAISKALRPSEHSRFSIPNREKILARYSLSNSVMAYAQLFQRV